MTKSASGVIQVLLILISEICPVSLGIPSPLSIIFADTNSCFSWWTADQVESSWCCHQTLFHVRQNILPHPVSPSLHVLESVNFWNKLSCECGMYGSNYMSCTHCNLSVIALSDVRQVFLSACGSLDVRFSSYMWRHFCPCGFEKLPVTYWAMLLLSCSADTYVCIVDAPLETGLWYSFSLTGQDFELSLSSSVFG